jgi:hypothetical protein
MIKNEYFKFFSGEWTEHFPHLLLDSPDHLADSLRTEEFHCPGVTFMKIFWRNSRPQWHNPRQNLRQYANRSINYANYTTGVKVLKLVHLCHLSDGQISWRCDVAFETTRL